MAETRGHETVFKVLGLAAGIIQKIKQQPRTWFLPTTVQRQAQLHQSEEQALLRLLQ